MSGVNGVFITVEDIETGGRMSTLHITLTAPSVSGEYMCLAENGAVGIGNINSANGWLTIHGER